MAYLSVWRKGHLKKVALVLSGVMLAACAADAGPRKKKPQQVRAERSDITASPRYASIVVDAKTGRVLQQRNADAPRFPASLTKIMTAYIAFEEMAAGRMNGNTNLQVSARCAAMAPSKLGLRTGSTIDLDDAILAIITKSANDAACTIGENISGSESAFAERMTRTARRIGMSNTTFRNASGLPNPNQITTARDMATLGRAIQERFPTQYRLFSTRSFAFRGSTFGNHNRLLGRVEGVDGIKTGYTRASGFNLVTSARDNGRHVVAVVLGGSTGRARDIQMTRLVGNFLPIASAGPRTDSVFASAGSRDADEPITRVAAVDRPAPVDIEKAATPTPRVAQPADVAPTLNTRILQPVAPMRAGVATAAPARLLPPPPAALPASASPAPVAAPTVAPTPVRTIPIAVRTVDDPITTASVPRREQGATQARQQAAAMAPSRREAATSVAPVPPPARVNAGGWIIQVGAFDTVDQARGKLARAKDEGGRALASASSFTEPVSRGAKTLIRARFAGFEDRDAAQAACSALKRRSIDCLALPQ